MPQPFKLTLSETQHAELTVIVTRHPSPYMRERAAALLKVADGLSLREVAMKRLLTIHDPDTLKLWITRYLKEGPTGLQIRKGRGRKPAFSPSAQSRAGERTATAYRSS